MVMAALKKKSSLEMLGTVAYILNFVLTLIAAVETLGRITAYLNDRARHKKSMGFTKDK